MMVVPNLLVLQLGRFTNALAKLHTPVRHASTFSPLVRLTSDLV
jgi:hypothetical protein